MLKNVETNGITSFRLMNRYITIKKRLPKSFTVVQRRYRFENFESEASFTFDKAKNIIMLIIPNIIGSNE